MDKTVYVKCRKLSFDQIASSRTGLARAGTVWVLPRFSLASRSTLIAMQIGLNVGTVLDASSLSFSND